MRRTILAFSLGGTLLFGISFVLSWLNPIWVERMASTAVRFEVEREAGQRVEALSGSPIVGLAQQLHSHVCIGRLDQGHQPRAHLRQRQQVLARAAINGRSQPGAAGAVGIEHGGCHPRHMRR